jgi:tryptophanyl-tRNA synthetase
MRIFSGVRPTGEIHLGNYLGAIKQWIDLQNNNEGIYCVVDLHAITTPYNPKELKDKKIKTAATYLSVGLNPEKSIIFIQSDIKEHTELAWLLETITPLGELKRMTQFKEKSEKHKQYINSGLLNYPVLMAADILLYQTEGVPVGEDQKQHVELTRTIARKFNKKFGKTFQIPKAIITKSGARIMSLQNPEKKMSKSGNPKGCIFLFEEPENIKKKIMSAVTDNNNKIIYQEDKKNGISNLLKIYSLISGKTIKELEKEFQNKSYADFKKSLTNDLIKSLKPFREKRENLLSRKVYIEEILKKGAEKAKVIAQSTIQDVKKKMGI